MMNIEKWSDDRLTPQPLPESITLGVQIDNVQIDI